MLNELFETLRLAEEAKEIADEVYDNIAPVYHKIGKGNISIQRSFNEAWDNVRMAQFKVKEAEKAIKDYHKNVK